MVGLVGEPRITGAPPTPGDVSAETAPAGATVNAVNADTLNTGVPTVGFAASDGAPAGVGTSEVDTIGAAELAPTATAAPVTAAPLTAAPLTAAPVTAALVATLGVADHGLIGASIPSGPIDHIAPRAPSACACETPLEGAVLKVVVALDIVDVLTLVFGRPMIPVDCADCATPPPPACES